MHTLAFVNQKGGCGKTTTAVHLAGALAAGDTTSTERTEGERGRSGRRPARVLLVDLDPQAHATMALGVPVEGEANVADVFLRGARPRDVLVDVAGGITLLPSSLELARFEEVADRVLHAEGFLARALAKAGRYDFVLVDCPPRADGVLTANALRAADTAVLVVETGAFALQGALRATRILEEVAVESATEFELRVVATLFDRRIALARDLLVGTQARFGDAMFDTVIHESVRLREAPAFGLPVQVLDPACRAAHDFAALADEVRALAEDVATVRAAARPRTSTACLPVQGVHETWMG